MVGFVSRLLNDALSNTLVVTTGREETAWKT